MKVNFLIILFSISTIFIYFKKEDKVENVKEIQTIKKVEVEEDRKSVV